MQMTSPSNPAARISGLVAVVLFHAVLIYVLVAGSRKQPVPVAIQPIQAQILPDQPAAPPAPPPPPTPQVALPPPPLVPLPDIRTEVPPPPKQEAKPSPAPVPTPTALPAPAAPAAAPVRTGAVRIASAGCDVPEKPAISDQLGETGTATISVSIGPDGSVTQRSVAGSSGFKRLDNAALAAISLCRFRPAMVDGKPEASTSTVRYRFQ